MGPYQTWGNDEKNQQMNETFTERYTYAWINKFSNRIQMEHTPNLSFFVNVIFGG